MTVMDLARMRTILGQAVMIAPPPGTICELDEEGWIGLTGLPSADLNLALVQSSAPARLAHTLERLEASGCPASLLLAGDAQAHAATLPSDWTPVGTLPIMSIELDATSGLPDPRIRVAIAEQDDETVARLSVEAFGMDPGSASAIATAGLSGDPDVVRIWLLEDAGIPVSSVLTVRIEETVSLWSMVTPPQFARHGYGRAILGGVLAWAAQDGASVGLLGATPAGEPLYRATGWRPVEEWQVFIQTARPPG